jgi:hypothetical protein
MGEMAECFELFEVSYRYTGIDRVCKEEIINDYPYPGNYPSFPACLTDISHL